MTSKKPLHIVLVSSWYPSDEHPFAGAFVQAQAHALAETGCKVGVISVDFCEGPSQHVERKEGDVAVYQYCAQATTPNQKRAFWFGGYRRAQKQLFLDYMKKHGKPDIVNIEGLWPAGRLIPWLEKKKIPCVVTEHSEEFAPQSTRKLLRTPFMLKAVLLPLARRAQSYSAPSAFLAHCLALAGLVSSPDDVRIIPNVVPLSEALPYDENANLRFVHVSSFSPAKNIELLLDSFVKVLAQKPAAHLVLVGDSEFKTHAEQLVHERHLGEHVEFTGYLDRSGIAEQFSRASAAILSSHFETFSSFAAEALMAGRPVVTTPAGGPQEFVEAAGGIVSDDASVEAFTRAWLHMAESYTAYKPEELHAYAVEHFAPELVAEQFISWYQEVLREHTGH